MREPTGEWHDEDHAGTWGSWDEYLSQHSWSEVGNGGTELNQDEILARRKARLEETAERMAA